MHVCVGQSESTVHVWVYDLFEKGKDEVSDEDIEANPPSSLDTCRHNPLHPSQQASFANFHSRPLIEIIRHCTGNDF